jgi:SAM-dependent methyltransferase
MDDDTTITAGEAFLRRFHNECPGVTPRALWAGRGPDGRSSYQWLADESAGRARVLDLACGDGALLTLLPAETTRTGLDMSHAELALAARRPELAGTSLVRGRAQDLPFPADAFDACVSHMAFMLMDSVDEVAAELARVLAPGGLLALVMGAGAGEDAYTMFRARMRGVLDDQPADRRMPPVGDRRTRTREGLDEILTPAGFGPVTWQIVPVDIGGDLDHVWTVMSGIYNMGPLDEDTVRGLRTVFESDTAAVTTPDGHVACTMRLHLVTALLR